MAKAYNMRQCSLKKGNAIQVSWLPDKFTKIGKYLKLKDNGKWEDGWQVIEVGDLPLSSEIVLSRADDYKHQREQSDI